MFKQMTTCIKRWNAEFMELFIEKKVKTITINTSESIDEICVTINGNINFKLTNKYPFCPPKTNIKNEPYSKYLQNPHCSRIIKVLDNMNITCLCCRTITCKTNWGPAYKIKNILDEITHVNEIKRYVKYFLLLDDICKVKNIHTDTMSHLILPFIMDNPEKV